MKIKAGPGRPINSLTPISTRPFPGDLADDLTGQNFSGLLVIGYFGPGSQWVCRCICGRYEVRRAKALKKHDQDKANRCTVCEAERNLRQHHEYIKKVA